MKNYRLCQLGYHHKTSDLTSNSYSYNLHGRVCYPRSVPHGAPVGRMTCTSLRTPVYLDRPTVGVRGDRVPAGVDL